MRSSMLSRVLCFSVPLALAACSHDQAPARSASGYQPGMTPASGTVAPSLAAASDATAPAAFPAPNGLNDGQIAGIVRAVNVAEINQAKLAVNKAHDASVKNFAEMMIAQHGQAVRNVDELDSRL